MSDDITVQVSEGGQTTVVTQENVTETFVETSGDITFYPSEDGINLIIEEGDRLDIILSAGSLLPIDSVGRLRTASEKKYNISDEDTSATPKYYGFLAVDGAWYILKINNSTYRYFRGDSGYQTGWTDRATLEYDYYDVIF